MGTQKWHYCHCCQCCIFVKTSIGILVLWRVCENPIVEITPSKIPNSYIHPNSQQFFPITWCNGTVSSTLKKDQLGRRPLHPVAAGNIASWDIDWLAGGVPSTGRLSCLYVQTKRSVFTTKTKKSSLAMIGMQTNKTRKSSCVNASGIPPAAYQVLSLVFSLQGIGYPVLSCPGVPQSYPGQREVS